MPPPYRAEVTVRSESYCTEGLSADACYVAITTARWRGNCEALEADKRRAAAPARWASHKGDQPPKIQTRPGWGRPLHPRGGGRRDFYFYGSNFRGPLAAASRRWSP